MGFASTKECISKRIEKRYEYKNATCCIATCGIFFNASQTISRVMSLGDHLSRPFVTKRFKQPTMASNRAGSPSLVKLGLASDGACNAVSVTRSAVSSYLAFSPLPLARRYVFCCAFLRVTPSGRYPSSCPVKPGLSSPGNSSSRDHLSDSLGDCNTKGTSGQSCYK